MEVQFTPETEKKLRDLSAMSGRGTDDLKSGRVKPVLGDEVEAYFREKSAAARHSHSGS